jgi:hypothetical protein
MDPLWMFAVLVFGIIVLPGMDIAFVLSSALVDGRRAGFAAVAGLVLGGMVHVAMGSIGVGLVLQHAPRAFNGASMPRPRARKSHTHQSRPAVPAIVAASASGCSSRAAPVAPMPRRGMA